MVTGHDDYMFCTGPTYQNQETLQHACSPYVQFMLRLYSYTQIEEKQ